LKFVIAVPLGVVAAKKQYSVTDYTQSRCWPLIGISMPTFFVATLLKLVFCGEAPAGSTSAA
jgi:peptide/nickel transport system permease protein